MASLPPSACCLAFSKEPEKPTGTITTVGGLETYVAGEKYGDEKVIVILTDIYGHLFPNVQINADRLSALGEIKVVVPDILIGDSVPLDHATPGFDFGAWLGKHGPPITSKIVDKFLNQIKADGFGDLYGIGYCFGAKFAIQHLAKDGLFVTAALAHPSLIAVEDVENLVKPVLISTGDFDSSFTPDLRAKTIEILSEKKTVRYQLDIFQGATHGYAVKGDTSIPEIKYAKEKTIVDQIYWFNSFIGSSKL